MTTINTPTSRIAAMVIDFALTDSTALLPWLERITGEPVEEMEPGASWRIRGAGGMIVGLLRTDPVNVAVQVGMAVAGVHWPFVFPDLLKEVNRRWREANKGKMGKRERAEEPLQPMLEGLKP